MGTTFRAIVGWGCTLPPLAIDPDAADALVRPLGCTVREYGCSDEDMGPLVLLVLDTVAELSTVGDATLAKVPPDYMADSHSLDRALDALGLDPYSSDVGDAQRMLLMQVSS